jgi:hypothetical protein
LQETGHQFEARPKHGNSRHPRIARREKRIFRDLSQDRRKYLGRKEARRGEGRKFTGLDDGAALLALLAALLGLALVLAHDRDTGQPVRHLRHLLSPPPPMREGVGVNWRGGSWKGKEAEESLAAALKVTKLRCGWRGQGYPFGSVADTCLPAE